MIWPIQAIRETINKKAFKRKKYDHSGIVHISSRSPPSNLGRSLPSNPPRNLRSNLSSNPFIILLNNPLSRVIHPVIC